MGGNIMKKLISFLIVVVLVSCSTPQHGFDYKRHAKYQKKIARKMERVNKRPGKTYFIIKTPINNINNDQQQKK